MMPIRRAFYCLTILTLWPIVALCVKPQTPKTSSLTDFLNAIHSMTADFQQITYDSKGQMSQNSTGKMALQKPNQFRWQVNSPQSQLLIADGRNLWIYDPDLAQATRQNLDATHANSPAYLLSGRISDLEKRFAVKSLPTPSNGAGFVLTPYHKTDLFAKVELDFQNESLTRMQLWDSLGNRTVFVFSNVKTNPSLKKSLFEFKAPKGTEVIQG